ncbi:hypothetical protein [Streptomyces sp. CdTB01]|uniref:hypothetical protein n=1 Tax=Streptomyces sp. CdTB01 TaxID=1725411 RepID=UPI00073AC5DE|nr:hypothetical protein [Streptomyces sp. CdTB01]ALV39331.1 hypothetical protein AS200_45445 [Streptomyces sp. CdTB01]
MYRKASRRVRWPVVVDRARQIVEGYAPLKIALRQVRYQLASEGVVPRTPPMCRRLSSHAPALISGQAVGAKPA